ncbi:IclR family transcriptional regulator [Vallitalea okinawensis]|uniref:IclR family transcriptional regulator n=1 Tax=Vallitalea okinawensis TaxID=2078660 RepID=UPI000CFDAA8C|nr:IclR family transcriptional regulator [Vallitalea okinawensis]
MKLHRSTFRCIEMLELVANHPDGITLTEISKIMDIPKSSAYDISGTLLALGMFEETITEVKKYKIGIKAFKIGNKYVKSNNLVAVAEPYLIELAERFNKTVYIGKMNKTCFVYTFKYEPKNNIVNLPNIGVEGPLHATSIGKTLLANYDLCEEVINDIEFTKFTENTITNPYDLNGELAKIKKLGYGMEIREYHDFLSSVAAPIYTKNDSIPTAIELSGIYSESQDLELEAKTVKEVADTISEILNSQVKA